MTRPELEQQYRREFEELEAGGPPSRSEPFAPFDRQEEANAFVQHLAQSAAIEAEVARVHASSTAAGYYEIIPEGGKAFQVKLLYRLHDQGVRFEDIPTRPIAQRLAMLRDHLHGQATRQGGWHATPASDAQLAWYADVAKLAPEQIAQAVRDARVAYLGQQKREGSWALWIAGAVAVLGAAIWFKGSTLVGAGLTGTAVVFAIFSATRQRS